VSIEERVVGEEIFHRLIASTEMERIASLAATRNQLVISGLSGSARALMLAALEKKTSRRLVFVARSNSEVEEIQPDVEFFYCAINGLDSCPSHIVTLPALESDPYDGTSPHAEVLEERALALYGAAKGDARIILTSIGALAERTASPDALKTAGLILRAGDDMPLELIVDMLIADGYLRQEPVGAVGEFSLRGGILDLFSPAHPAPHRLEFFGDTVESIRQFDADSQRSTGRVEETVIVPMREVAVRREEFVHWAEAAKKRWSVDRFRRDLRERLAHAERGEAFEGWEFLLPLTRPLRSSAMDYFKDTLLVIDEPAEIEKRASELYRNLAARYHQADEEGTLSLAPEELFLTADELRTKLDQAHRVEFRLLGREAAATDEQFDIEGVTLTEAPPQKLFLFTVGDSTPDIEMISRSQRRYEGRVQEMVRDLETSDQTTLFVMPSPGLCERVREMLGEYGVSAPFLSLNAVCGDETMSRFIITVGKPANGFSLASASLNLLTESDVFGQHEIIAPPSPARKQRRAAAFLSDLGDLKVGDYVVHIDHGIGQFQGLRQIAAAGGPTGNVAAGLERAPVAVREFMLLAYADGGNLYVPVERLDLVQRYSAAEGHTPQLDRLGAGSWAKTKARVKRAMRDMAEELLKLYAERKLVLGHAYGEDTPWQREFEDSFEYELTPDQQTTIEDVKADMENPQPMDRLVVGDVGYGKTEVAMRAAFKAVMEGKQVAVLAPTTVLVYQHYKTFQQRMSAFPVKIEMLSRFRSSREQKEIIKAIEQGSIDIIIGTHRLLSKDVRFKDLGLLVVDEEQRFGVAHKERLKHLRKKVDVIAMSATPIPRTLNISLAGLRDMSVIETPPRDRLAIQTHVVQFSENVIRSAIELELQRGGQVFFVHNRVETINAVAELINRLVPQARLGVGHGQMSEKQLEDVILKFIFHETDVLVSTTIIENGIDIPMANTIVINRADRYGLSQLYQLRGRVGRMNRRAYAYLLIPSEEELTPVARRRLAAIREFSDLGAGFRIAALDLELRGAGNFLGAEQSGHIESVGFDLYTQMLERAVRELKGEAIEDEISTAVNLGVDIRIPEQYIYDVSQRLRAYKRISSAQSEGELSDIHSEMADRYGQIPETVENLFEYARLRREASRMGVVSIDREQDRLAIKFSEQARIDPDKLIEYVSLSEAQFTPGGVLKMKSAAGDDKAIFAQVRALFDQLR
jgi:transcription-repair coupling factor (superfamily II helicase)